MDVGARVYNCFIGATGSIYHAAFQLRLRPSPGAVPNVIEQPPRVLDLAHTVVINPPWPTDETIDSRIRQVIEDDHIVAPVETNVVTGIISNTVTKQFVEDLGISGGGGGSGVDTNAVLDLIGPVIETNATVVSHTSQIGQLSTSKRDLLDLGVYGTDWRDWVYPAGFPEGLKLIWGYNPYAGDGSFAWLFGWGPSLASTDENATTIILPVSELNRYEAETGVHFSSPVTTTRRLATEAHVSAAVSTKADLSSLSSLSSSVSSLSASVSTLSTYLGGEDARLTVTNYYGSIDLPHLYVEQKISEAGTNYWKNVWDEMTRWNWLTGNYLPANYYTKSAIDAALGEKADRAWGFYDSHTGAWAPDGFTSISSGSIIISKDMSYQRTIESEHSMWLLVSTDPTLISGTATNGFFRIMDAEGNACVEIIKGDRRSVPAVATSFTSETISGVPYFRCLYPVQSGDHPKGVFCADLAAADWKDEDDPECPFVVDWSGDPGAWVMRWNPKDPSTDNGFAQATYEAGGETRIKHSIPVEMSKIVINGTTYRLGTATISGNTVITLTPTL